MTADEIIMGGLLACCVQSIRENERPGTQGETRSCQMRAECQTEVIFDQGEWRWHREVERPGF